MFISHVHSLFQGLEIVHCFKDLILYGKGFFEPSKRDGICFPANYSSGRGYFDQVVLFPDKGLFVCYIGEDESDLLVIIVNLFVDAEIYSACLKKWLEFLLVPIKGSQFIQGQFFQIFHNGGGSSSQGIQVCG